jgi:hypothetical protein
MSTYMLYLDLQGLAQLGPGVEVEFRDDGSFSLTRGHHRGPWVSPNSVVHLDHGDVNIAELVRRLEPLPRGETVNALTDQHAET